MVAEKRKLERKTVSSKFSTMHTHTCHHLMGLHVVNKMAEFYQAYKLQNVVYLSML